MAVTKTITKAVPYNLNSKVQRWDITMKYEDGADATYYTSKYEVAVEATDSISGVVNFTPKAEGSWTLAELTALCPVSQWDTVFASQYDSVITNPPNDPVSNRNFVIPS